MADSKDGCEADEFGLPVPTLPDLDDCSHTALDYLSEEYAAAKNLDDAIAIRGHKAFAKSVKPEDFAEDTAQGVERIGIADLWAQSTWSSLVPGSRDVELERSVAGIAEGDVLIHGGMPAELREGPERQNWMEIRDLGFGFYREGTFLPFTPYHDYDQDMFLDAISTLRPGERIVGVVRESSCNGEDGGVPADPDFNWRVYWVKVTVYKMDASASLLS